MITCRKQKTLYFRRKHETKTKRKTQNCIYQKTAFWSRISLFTAAFRDCGARIATKAADLKEVMTDLQNGTSEIASTIEINTTEIVRVTEATELLVSNTEAIQKEANDNHRISDLLSTEVGKFR